MQHLHNVSEYVEELDSMVWLARTLKKNVQTSANRSRGQPQFSWSTLSFNIGNVMIYKYEFIPTVH